MTANKHRFASCVALLLQYILLSPAAPAPFFLGSSLSIIQDTAFTSAGNVTLLLGLAGSKPGFANAENHVPSRKLPNLTITSKQSL